MLFWILTWWAQKDEKQDKGQCKRCGDILLFLKEGFLCKKGISKHNKNVVYKNNFVAILICTRESGISSNKDKSRIFAMKILQRYNQKVRGIKRQCVRNKEPWILGVPQGCHISLALFP